MKAKIFVVFFISFMCFTGFCNNVYGLTNAVPENEQKEVKKDKYEMVTGKIKKIIVKDKKRSLLIADEKGNEYIFHIGEYTIVTTFDELKIGDEVDIIFNGILTMSIPPQGNAIIINALKV
ncbi:DUF3221 domain-containing protein [Clostridium grantii]|uniref:DUF3221 domain-containing protein n=1 Tax=Clostridium grantii DSM 8605 TaxID=1121316 RepID=A0A1M5V636_9CLOT|nr:DUF3221 domain-containing protein [Clostridium grantii]SHH70598.1 hypothetical protein SAMN02745207_02105 [Clostridium grantii DSM 8605]